jgi:hypothetical protein
MKHYIPILIILFFFIVGASAQTDTLVIKLKNGQTEKITVSQIKAIKFENITGIEAATSASGNLSVLGNYPNPFDEKTNIEFEITSDGPVSVLIYDINGEQIQKLECTDCLSGKNSLQWDCRDKDNLRVKTGLYYYEVLFKNHSQTRKMVLIH